MKIQKVSASVLTQVVGAFALLVGAAANGQPNLTGVWKTFTVSPEDPNWSIIDALCNRCGVAQYKYLEVLLNDPANDDTPVREIRAQAREYFEDYFAELLTPQAKREQSAYKPETDPALDCNPDGDGLFHQISAPVPIQIEQGADEVTIRYEYWNAVRTVHMDGRGHPTDVEHGRLGHSIGWYEGSDLVVESVGMITAVDFVPGGTIIGSEDAVITERYTVSDDGVSLSHEWTVDDPSHFREPFGSRKSYLHAPDWELNEFLCEAITGEY